MMVHSKVNLYEGWNGGTHMTVHGKIHLYEGWNRSIQTGQTKDYKIGICCFPAKHATLRRKSRLVGSELG